ncbi:MAG: hypothetical protein ABIQ51_10740 [Mesorhizobium sp.]
MSTDAFEVLGIGRDGATENDLKKAYAAKLKQTRPAQDREGFIELRDAYEKARQYIRNAKPPGNLVTSVKGSYKTDVDLEDEISNIIEIELNFLSSQILTSPAIRVLKKIEILVADPWQWQRMENWLQVLDDADLRTIDDLQEFDALLLSYICQESGVEERSNPLVKPWMSHQLIELFDRRFGWVRNSGSDFLQTRELDWFRSLNPVHMPPAFAASIVPSAQSNDVEPPASKTSDRPWFLGSPVILSVVFVVFKILMYHTPPSTSDVSGTWSIGHSAVVDGQGCQWVPKLPGQESRRIKIPCP